MFVAHAAYWKIGTGQVWLTHVRFVVPCARLDLRAGLCFPSCRHDSVTVSEL